MGCSGGSGAIRAPEAAAPDAAWALMEGLREGGAAVGAAETAAADAADAASDAASDAAADAAADPTTTAAPADPAPAVVG